MLSSRSRSPGIASDVTATIGRSASSRALADLADDRLAAAARNLHVEQQQIGRAPTPAPARASSTVAASTTSWPRSSRRSCNQQPIEGVVLDDQNAGRRDRARGPRKFFSLLRHLRAGVEQRLTQPDLGRIRVPFMTRPLSDDALAHGVGAREHLTR